MAFYMRDKKNEYLLRGTLSCILNAMVGSVTTIDLRNEAAIRGRIVDVDGYMNVELEDCIFKSPRDEYFPMDNFFVCARNLRYVHIPQNTTAEELMKQGLKPKRTFVKKDNKAKTFKKKRAAAYQESILQEIHSKTT